MRWSIRQKRYLDQVALGDEVYIWRSDGEIPGSGGVIARCELVGLVEYITGETGKEYWLTDGWKTAWPCVSLRPLEIRLDEGMLLRSQVAENPILRNLRIITIRQQTNFLLTPAEAAELRKLWGGEQIYPYDIDSAQTFPEGRLQYKRHRFYERNSMLVKRVKEQ